MYYVDSQRTLTRRDSSLLANKRVYSSEDKVDYDVCSTTHPPSTVDFISDSPISSVVTRPKVSVETELVTMLFDSMLDSIVQSWQIIVSHKPSAHHEESPPADFDKASTDLKKKKTTGKPTKSKRSQSKMDVFESIQSDPLSQSWWSSPDERAIICFTNGNTFEGDISMKCMHGRGRFQWTDGTVYLGQFKDNEICGKGAIQWKDDSWYEGDFVGNIRHGRGLYVDSRKQRSYTGGWHCGTKHGTGTIFYNATFKNSYDGDWVHGQFKDNEICGKGAIQWKDDSWYEGDFVGNIRHGRGLYVDSRKQRSYTGGWHCGTKHGTGTIFYNATFKNSYDGDWVHNVRHGFGSREYCPRSGYKGYWDTYIREGKGLMIWPNNDFYRGEWINGVMSGYGIYIWDAYYNNTMSLPSINAYRGYWEKGERHGYGILNLGSGQGSHYKGDFKHNKKHGVGKFVTNSGLILKHKNLFIDDNMGSLTSIEKETDESSQEVKQPVQVAEPFLYEMYDDSVGLIYHILQAIKHIDKKKEVRSHIINEYIEKNKTIETDLAMIARKENNEELCSDFSIEDFIDFEESSLRKSLRCYESELKSIYYKYATICNTDQITFTPVLIRLYFWQFYYDCSIHEKGLTLVAIDRMFHKNPEWLAITTHNPFEKIYYWQFIHCLITVASHLYAKRQLPDKKPDTILANALRTFMEQDVLPAAGRQKGRLVKLYGTFVPLKGLYSLYRKIGEPHTVRKFMCSVRRPPHFVNNPQPPLVEASDNCLPIGRNAYVLGDDMTFVTDDPLLPDEANIENHADLKLFNIGNLSSRAIINIFAQIFPELCEGNKIMNLDIEITFYEFFEAFIMCAEESIRIKDEEEKWRQKFSL